MLWDRFLRALPFVLLTLAAAVGFHLFWRGAVERRDDDLPTKIASFLVFLFLVLLVFWLRCVP